MQNRNEKKDGWHVFRLNHDAAAFMLYTPVMANAAGRRQKTLWKYDIVWRLADISGMRTLKVVPSHLAAESQLAGEKLLSYALFPKELSI